MERHILSLLVNNRPGILVRISGLLNRRGYTIGCLSIRETDDPELSRMTIVMKGDDYTIVQAKNQLNKLVDVVKVVELKDSLSVYRELALVKINATPTERMAIGETANIFRAKIVDVAEEVLTVEVTGDEAKILAFIDLMKPYGIKEVARTGLTALERGNRIIRAANME